MLGSTLIRITAPCTSSIKLNFIKGSAIKIAKYSKFGSIVSYFETANIWGKKERKEGLVKSSGGWKIKWVLDWESWRTGGEDWLILARIRRRKRPRKYQGIEYQVKRDVSKHEKLNWWAHKEARIKWIIHQRTSYSNDRNKPRARSWEGKSYEKVWVKAWTSWKEQW